MTPLALCKVTIPFRRTDLPPIKFAIDMIFLDDQPYAVTDWSEAAAGTMPTFVLKLDNRHLRRDLARPQRYTYDRVMDDPRLQA